MAETGSDASTVNGLMEPLSRPDGLPLPAGRGEGRGEGRVWFVSSNRQTGELPCLQDTEKQCRRGSIAPRGGAVQLLTLCYDQATVMALSR
jgi:hypothetical protein